MLASLGVVQLAMIAQITVKPYKNNRMNELERWAGPMRGQSILQRFSTCTAVYAKGMLIKAGCTGS